MKTLRFFLRSAKLYFTKNRSLREFYRTINDALIRLTTLCCNDLFVHNMLYENNLYKHYRCIIYAKSEIVFIKSWEINENNIESLKAEGVEP